MAEPAAIVLAAGAGERFGGPKQLARLDGRPLLDHVIDAARGVPALARIVLVLGAHGEAIRDAIDLTGVEVVQCAGWAEGQAASLRAGAAALDGDHPAVILLADMPLVTPQVIAGALDQLVSRYDVVRTTHAGRPTHPVVLSRRALADVPNLEGDTGARALFGELSVREWEAGHLFDAADVDTPEDLAALGRDSD